MTTAVRRGGSSARITAEPKAVLSRSIALVRGCWIFAGDARVNQSVDLPQQVIDLIRIGTAGFHPPEPVGEPVVAEPPVARKKSP